MDITLDLLQQRKKAGKPRVMVLVRGTDISAPTDVDVQFEITRRVNGNRVSLSSSQASGLSCAEVEESGRRAVTARALVGGVEKASTQGILDFDKNVSPDGEPDPGPCPGD